MLLSTHEIDLRQPSMKNCAQQSTKGIDKSQSSTSKIIFLIPITVTLLETYEQFVLHFYVTSFLDGAHSRYHSFALHQTLHFPTPSIPQSKRVTKNNSNQIITGLSEIKNILSFVWKTLYNSIVALFHVLVNTKFSVRPINMFTIGHCVAMLV